MSVRSDTSPNILPDTDEQLKQYYGDNAKINLGLTFFNVLILVIIGFLTL